MNLQGGVQKKGIQERCPDLLGSSGLAISESSRGPSLGSAMSPATERSRPAGFELRPFWPLSSTHLSMGLMLSNLVLSGPPSWPELSPKHFRSLRKHRLPPASLIFRPASHSRHPCLPGPLPGQGCFSVWASREPGRGHCMPLGERGQAVAAPSACQAPTCAPFVPGRPSPEN